jgi:hypothetical protein
MHAQTYLTRLSALVLHTVRLLTPTLHNLLTGTIAIALALTPASAFAALTVSADNGALIVTSDADDAILPTCAEGIVQLNGAAAEGDIACADVTTLTITGGPGPNTIDASGVLTEDFTSLTTVVLRGGGGNDTITGTIWVDEMEGGPGNDILAGVKANDQMHGGPGADELIWRNGDGSDRMEGDDGYDRVHVIGAAGRGDAFSVAQVGERVVFSRTNLGLFTLDIGGTEQLQIYRGDPEDTVQVQVLTATNVLIDAVQPISTPVAPQPLVITGAGAITNTVEAYRLLLGGENNGGEPGSRPNGRREINWDGVPEEESAPNFYAPDFFNQPEAPRARGAVFSTPGEGLMISAASDNSAGVLPRFGNLNPTYVDSFQAFSEEKLFSPVGSNIVDLVFYVPGTDTPAVSRGFGAVYADVDTEHTAFEYFDIAGNSLGTFGAPIADQGLSFLGVIFPEPIVHRVRIHYGTAALGPDDSAENDVAVMDDFIYGEPQPVAEQTAEPLGETPAAIADEIDLLLTAAPDTPDYTPYSDGLVDQAELALSHAQLAAEALANDDLGGGRLHAEHVWNILHGEASNLYGDVNEDGRTQNPGDGYGVRPYAFRVAEVADGIAELPDLDAPWRAAAVDVAVCARNIATLWGPQADDGVLALLYAVDAESAQPAAATLVSTLDALFHGVDADGDGTIEPARGECGAEGAHDLSHRLLGEGSEGHE